MSERKRWEIRDVDTATREKIVAYAKANKLTVAQALDKIASMLRV